MNLGKISYLSAAILAASLTTGFAQDPQMSFFVTSAGLGDGANLGGVEGADAYCATLAQAAGSDGQNWVAYLSTQAEGKRGISARDRIGTGPWHNAIGDLVATNLDELHILPNLYKSTAVDESGNLVNGRGDKPNEHDILTGTQPDGTAFFPWQEGDHTCNNWTSNAEGSAMVGHHDRHGGGNTYWAGAHQSRGCSQEDLTKTGGAGRFYCFAVK